MVEKYEQICEDAYKKASEETQVFHKHWLDSPWSGFFEGKDPLKVIISHPFLSIERLELQYCINRSWRIFPALNLFQEMTYLFKK